MTYTQAAAHFINNNAANKYKHDRTNETLQLTLTNLGNQEALLILPIKG